MHFPHLTSIDEGFWTDVARRCDWATFFHTPLWSRLVTQTFPAYVDASVGATLDDGTRVVLPRLRTPRVRGGLFYDEVSTFRGCYGGVVSDRPINAETQHALYRAASRSWRLSSLKVTSSPLARAPMPTGSRDVRQDFCQILDLSPGYERLASAFASSNRTKIRKAHRAGLTIRTATARDTYREYYDLYRDSLRRWGDAATSSYPWTLFEHGQVLAERNPEHVKLWMCFREDIPVAGAWVFYWNRHAVIWHSASRSSEMRHGPNNLLRAEAIRHACENGFRWFDFNPSGGHEGVVKFKESFGASRTPIERHAIVGRVWARLPLSRSITETA